MPMKIVGWALPPSLLAPLFVVLWVGAVSAQDSKTFDLNLVGGQVEGDPGAIRVSQDDKVLIRWQTDRETEIHLHGYDVKSNLSPGAVTEMDFEAHATGRFPITAHGHHSDAHDEPVLVHVEVYPD